jgi:hypothetical protein
MIRRRKPLLRTALKQPTLEQVWKWQRKPRKPLPKVGRKAKREQQGWDACRAQVISRSRGYCEGNVLNVCPSGLGHGASHVHHVWPEDRRDGVHDPERCLHLCAEAHRWVHDNPLEAGAYGLLRPHDGKVKPCR